MHFDLIGGYGSETCNRLVEAIEIYVGREKQRIESKRHQLLTSLSHSHGDRKINMLVDDRKQDLEDVEELAFELAIIALYKHIETKTKRAALVAFPDLSQESVMRMRAPKLEETLREGGVSIREIEHFEDFNELRLINNSLKHSGVVSDELAKHAGWEAGQRLSNLASTYKRVAPLCVLYLSGLMARLREKIVQ